MKACQAKQNKQKNNKEGKMKNKQRDGIHHDNDDVNQFRRERNKQKRK